MLLILQVALSIVLFVGAGLFAQTERNLRSVDLGFNDSHLLLFSVSGAPLGDRRRNGDACTDGWPIGSRPCRVCVRPVFRPGRW